MDSQMFKVLEKYREDDDPDLRQLNGMCISTLSMSECMQELKNLDIDGEKLCRVGGMEARQETVAKLLHFAMELAEESVNVPSGSGNVRPIPPGPPAKKLKVAASTDCDAEKTSISDVKNTAFLKFLHNVEDDQNNVQSGVQPGGDLQSYLQDLRTSSSLRYYGDGSTYIPKSREAQELQAILRGLDSPSTPQGDGLGERQASGQFTRPVSCVSSRGQSPCPPSTPKSATHKVLSSKKLAASLKSVNYLGRESSSVTLDDDDYVGDEYVGASDIHDYEGLQPVTQASATHKGWSPIDSTDPELLDIRRSLYKNDEELETDDSNIKRRRFREKSCLSEGLYQGRNAHRVKDHDVKVTGDGHVKVTGKGEGQLDGDGQKVMDFIAEENGESKHILDNGSAIGDDDVESGVTWADKVETAEKHLLDANRVDNITVGNLLYEHKRLLPRRGSGSSIGSGGSLYSMKTPSIITIQNYTAPLVANNTHENFKNVYTKRTVMSPKYKHRRSQPERRTPQPVQQFQEIKVEVNQPSQQNLYSPFYDAFVQVNNATVESPTWLDYQYQTDTRTGDELAVTAEVTDNTDGDRQDEVRPADETLVEVEEPNIDEDRVSRLSSSSSDSSYFRLQSELYEGGDCNVEPIAISPAQSDNAGREPEENFDVDLNEGYFQEEVMMDEENLEVITEIVDGRQTKLGDHYEADETHSEDIDAVVEDQQDDALCQALLEETNQDQDEDVTLGDTEALKHYDDDQKVAEEYTDEELSEGASQDSAPQFINHIEDDFGDSEIEYLVEDEAAYPRTPLMTEQYAETVIAPVVEDSLVSNVALSSDDSRRPESTNSCSGSGKLTSDNLDLNKATSEKLSRPVSQASSSKIDPEIGSVGASVRPTSSTGSSISGARASSAKSVPRDSRPGSVTKVHIQRPPSSSSHRTTNTPDVPNVEVVTDVKVNTVKETEAKKGGKTTESSEGKTGTSTSQIGGRQKALKGVKPADQRRRPAQTSVGSKGNAPAKESGTAKKEDSKGDVVNKTEEKVITNATDLDAITKELDSLGLPKPVPGKKTQKAKGSTYVPPPPGKRPPKPKEKVVIPEHMKDTLESQPTRSYEALEDDLERRGILKNGKVTHMVHETLSGPTLEAVGEGLTEAELELAKRLLQEKINKAKDKIYQPETDKSTVSTPPKKKAPAPKTPKTPTPKAPATKVQAIKSTKKVKGKKVEVDTRTDQEKQMDAIREKQKEDEEKRNKEARELHRKISERRMLLKAQEEAASAKSRDIREEMERLEREADDIQLAEDDARTALAEVRKKQREEREIRRKAELERKKQEVFQRREREKKELEEQRKKELALMEKIADADMQRRMREEEERKMYEEERLAQERLEVELRAVKEAAEEEEEHLKELERQAEEEAMQRLIDEREAAERQRRRLQEEKDAMEAVERRKREYLLAEARKLQEEKERKQQLENEMREAERQRLEELRRLESAARARMQEELEVRRSEALARREFNLDNKENVTKLGHGQGITRAWTFSYFIRWPRDSYTKSMGLADPKKWRWNRKSKQQKSASTAPRPTT